MALNPTLLFILKAPIVGSVKTRLAEEIGEVRALIAYQKMAKYLFDQLAPHYPYEVHYAPSDALDLMCSWLGEDHQFFPQREGDLGARMEEAVRSSFERSAETVILLGGDCPYVTCSVVGKASMAMRRSDAVIGPATDGGYYLLGMQTMHPCLFEDIPWSTDGVFRVTLERIKEAGLTVEILESLEDVDNLASWTRAEAYIGKEIAASE